METAICQCDRNYGGYLVLGAFSNTPNALFAIIWAHLGYQGSRKKPFENLLEWNVKWLHDSNGISGIYFCGFFMWKIRTVNKLETKTISSVDDHISDEPIAFPYKHRMITSSVFHYFEPNHILFKWPSTELIKWNSEKGKRNKLKAKAAQHNFDHHKDSGILSNQTKGLLLKLYFYYEALFTSHSRSLDRLWTCRCSESSRVLELQEDLLAQARREDQEEKMQLGCQESHETMPQAYCRWSPDEELLP